MPKQPPYPKEFKREAVQLVLSGRSKTSVADSLGCSAASLDNWVKQHLADTGALPEQATSAEKAENRELRAKVRRLEQERDILKKAAAFFARESDTLR